MGCNKYIPKLPTKSKKYTLQAQGHVIVIHTPMTLSDTTVNIIDTLSN